MNFLRAGIHALVNFALELFLLLGQLLARCCLETWWRKSSRLLGRRAYTPISVVVVGEKRHGHGREDLMQLLEPGLHAIPDFHAEAVQPFLNLVQMDGRIAGSGSEIRLAAHVPLAAYRRRDAVEAGR